MAILVLKNPNTSPIYEKYTTFPQLIGTYVIACNKGF